jgi:hypothetical protein
MQVSTERLGMQGKLGKSASEARWSRAAQKRKRGMPKKEGEWMSLGDIG